MVVVFFAVLAVLTLGFLSLWPFFRNLRKSAPDGLWANLRFLSRWRGLSGLKVLSRPGSSSRRKFSESSPVLPKLPDRPWRKLGYKSRPGRAKIPATPDLLGKPPFPLRYASVVSRILAGFIILTASVLLLKLNSLEEKFAESDFEVAIATNLLLSGLLVFSAIVLIRSSSRIKDGNSTAFWGIVVVCGIFGIPTVLLFFPFGLFCLSAVFAMCTRTSRTWMAQRRARLE